MPAATCAEATPGSARETFLPARDYDLAATLASGQAFRWGKRDGAWTGVVAGRWVRLRPRPGGIAAETVVPQKQWAWLKEYLQTEVDFDAVLRSFPDDEPMRTAVAACRGLRLLRQKPWECLASFLMSSTKQIVQIRQIIGLLCERFGEEVTVPAGCVPARAFPSAERIASAGEAELRACKMGFRAPSLRATARLVAEGGLDLEGLRARTVAEARVELLRCRGVGEKIANCVLLFAYGFPEAFPVDVWVRRALRELYFPKRAPSPARLEKFAATHFGPHAGYAQQYLFHYMRTRRVGETRRDAARSIR